jgi:hypothetical protein
MTSLGTGVYLPSFVLPRHKTNGFSASSSSSTVIDGLEK